MRARSWLKVGQTKSWKTSRSGAFIWANTSGCKADADRQDAFPFQGSQPSQHLALTPQLQQSIRLLQLSTLELNQELEQALMDNPLLERDDDPLAGHARLAADGSIVERERGAEAGAAADGSAEAESGA